MGPWHSDWTEAEHAKFIRIHPNRKKKHHGLFWHTSVDPQLHLKAKDYWILEEQMVLIEYLKKYLKKFPCFNSCQLLPEQELSNSMDRCGQVAAIACPSKCWPKKTPKTKWSSCNQKICQDAILPSPKKRWFSQPSDPFISIFGGFLCHKPRLRGGKTTTGRSWWSSYVRLPGEFWSNTLGSSPTYLGETQQFKVTGWWFGAFFIFHNILGIILPNWFSYFSEGQVYHQPGHIL